MNRSIIIPILSAILFVFLQVTLFQQFHIFNLAKPFIYIFPILFFPINTARSFTLPLAFLIGMVVDIFSQSYGINAAACVLIAFIREPLLKWILNVDENLNGIEPHANALNYSNFILYVVAMVFVHGSTVLLLENFTFNTFWQTAFAILVNTLITSLLLFIIEFLFFKTAQGRE